MEQKNSVVSEVQQVNEINLIGKPETLTIIGKLPNLESLPEKIIQKINYLKEVEKISIEFAAETTKQAQIIIPHTEADPNQTLDIALSLLGTALVQERAGIAFRAAGQNKPIPSEGEVDFQAIITGINDQLSVDQQSNQVNSKVDPLDISADHYQGILEPILSSFASNGAIAAAPPPKADQDPNYWFFWQRDAGNVAICMHNSQELFESTISNQITEKLQTYIQFVTQFPHNQQIAKTGLGISRCTIQGDPIESYGSPQNDGPALTALAILDIVKDPNQGLDSAKSYLDYLCTAEGSELSFDPWEFSVGKIFYIDNLQRKALRKAVKIAESINAEKEIEKYTQQIKFLEDRLSSYFDSKLNYLRATQDEEIPWMKLISNIDISIIGSILVNYDVTDEFFNLDHSYVKSTMQSLERSFCNKWQVNRDWKNQEKYGCAMGRFPEDMNDGITSTGGNPWTFATLWTAQFYYRYVQRLRYLKVTNHDNIQELLQNAEGYLSFVLSYQNINALTEQIDNRTGQPRGAQKLSWAHAELLNTFAIRQEAINNA